MFVLGFFLGNHTFACRLHWGLVRLE